MKSNIIRTILIFFIVFLINLFPDSRLPNLNRLDPCYFMNQAVSQSLNPPKNLSASVFGDTVHLSWDPPQDNESKNEIEEEKQKFNSIRFLEWNRKERSTARKTQNKLSYTGQFLIELDEVEPNNDTSNAQVLSGDSLISVNGNAEISDEGNFVVVYSNNYEDDLEDLFKLTINSPGLNITLSEASSDLDLFLIDGNADSIIAASNLSGVQDEELNLPSLDVGSYYIAVSIYDIDPAGPNSSPYKLTVSGDIYAQAGLQFYKIYRSLSPNAFSSGASIAMVPGFTTNYTDIINENVHHDQTYYYQVTAVYDSGESVPSNETSAQIKAVPVTDFDAYRVEPVYKGMEYLSGETAEIFGPNVFWELSDVIDLPFGFRYIGHTYNQIKVSSNGFITFDITETYHYLDNDLANPDLKNAVAPFWTYLAVSSTGKVHYQTIGEAPNRKFIVEFYHVLWGNFSSSPLLNFQVVLFEGSNDIEFHYGTMEEAGFGSNGASIGIKDDEGNFINAMDNSRDNPQNNILKPPKTNFRFTTSPPPPNDVGVCDITVEKEWFVHSPNTIAVKVKNNGSQTQSGFTVAYQIGEDQPVREVFPAELDSGSIATMVFNTRWEPQKAGEYSIIAWTELDGDANSLNDSTFIENAIMVYEIELPPPVQVNGFIETNNRIHITWEAGHFRKPLPGKWYGTTNEDQDVYMKINYNSTYVDTCKIYYLVEGNPFSYPLKNYSRKPIKNNKFSFYYNDQYGRMSTDVKGTFIPPDSCSGTWRAGVYVNYVYTVYSGTWEAKAKFAPPILLGYKIYRSENPDVQPVSANLLAEISNPENTGYIDAQAIIGVNYYYIVVGVYDRGNSDPSDEILVQTTPITDKDLNLPKTYCLYPVFPNPFNPQTTIQYDLPEMDNVTLEVYNMLGEKIATLVNKRQPAGRYKVVFAAGNYSSGMFFIVLKTSEYHAVQRAILLK